MDSFAAFTQCMVDGDPEVIRRERKVRRAGLVLSVTIQAGLVAALILIPFLTPAALPHLMSLVQIPTWRPPVIVHQLPARAISGNAPSIPSPSANTDQPVARPRTFNPAPSGLGADIPTSFGGQAGNPLEGVVSAGDFGPAAPAATREAPHKPVSMSGGVMEALLLNRVQPDYPKIAEAMRLSGPVVLSAIIAPDGSIQSLRVVSGSPILAAAAQQAVRQWRYKPTMLNGQPVEVETLITVNFVLD
jgi:protein TonB